MPKFFVLAALIVGAFAASHVASAADDTLSRREQVTSASAEVAEALFDEIVGWICTNFDLPSTQNPPRIRFATSTELAHLRIEDRNNWHGFVQQDADVYRERNVVAVYDRVSRTIYLPDNWIGKSAIDQSILVHEMVHHLQNLGQLKFECPAAREKTAYLAQDMWLARSGTSLEKEFDVDMFTVIVSSSCM